MIIPNVYKLKKYKDKIKPSEYTVQKLKNYPPVTGLTYEFKDEKAKTKFVKKVESVIRSSPEYKRLIKFLREEIDMTYCSFYNKVNGSIKGVSIEIHHSPFNLYTLTYIVLNKFIEEDIEIDPLMVAEEVMALHYYGLVGLIPLSETVHELVHNDKVFIPVHVVFGDVAAFYEDYKKYMSPEQKDVLMNNISLSRKMEKMPDKLKKKFVYLELDGMELPFYKKDKRKIKVKRK